jgi:hypothetical protein
MFFLFSIYVIDVLCLNLKVCCRCITCAIDVGDVLPMQGKQDVSYVRHILILHPLISIARYVADVLHMQ